MSFTITHDTPMSTTSGAISLDKNLADSTGKITLAASGALAMGVGVAVAPVPTILLASVGATCMVAGNFREITEHFTASIGVGEEDGVDPNNA